MDIKEPIKRDKKLNITVLADNSQYGIAAAHQGVLLAEVFQATLSVIANFDFHLPDKTKKIDTDFLEKLKTATQESDDCKIFTEYVFPETLFKYAEDNNTAMFVIGVSNNKKDGFFDVKKAIKFIKSSRFPVITITEDYRDATPYKHVLLSLDIERQNKEKALWAGYFSRFYGSIVKIFYPEYKDEGLSKAVNDNVAFVEKLYANLDISYEKHTAQSQSYFDQYAIENGERFEAGAAVIMMTKYYTLADVITGPRERKIIGRSKIPVLCINQRDDLYVLCT